MAGTYSHTIGPRDIDSTRRARIAALGDIVLGAANDDADSLGFGVSDLNLGNASWVLSRLALEARRLPERGERIDIYTWVSDYGRVMTTRNMTLSSEPGSGGEPGDTQGVWGAAVTQWAMIDLDTRRPLDLSALSNKGTSLVDREPPIERPRKVTPLPDECFGERTVLYSDIDFNGHVGSMRYVEWMMDLMQAEWLRGAAEGFRLDINYLHEATLGETLTIARADQTRFEIRNATGVAICRARFVTGETGNRR